MKTKTFRIISIFMLVVLVLTIGTIIAGTIAKSNLAKQYPAPGQLVDVGGYKMHINCTGQGSPTIILAAGMGDFSITWAKVQPEIARFTRVCSYDRAGFGWSEPSSLPSTASTMVKELHTLLVNASIQGPYLLVGHSMGGMLVRAYAHNYPDKVVGMVLLDSLHEERPLRLPALVRANQDMNGQFRMLDLLSATGIMALLPQLIPNPDLPAEAYAQYQAILATTGYFKTAIAETNAIEDSCAEVRALHITGFGNMPLIVFSAGQEEVIPSLTDAENQQILKEILVEQSELAALSSDSKLINAEQSGHFIQKDQPDLVIGAIREMMDAIRK